VIMTTIERSFSTDLQKSMKLHFNFHSELNIIVVDNKLQMEEVHESPLKWIASTDLDAPFLNDLSRNGLSRISEHCQMNHFNCAMFFPSVAKQVLKTQKNRS